MTENAPSSEYELPSRYNTSSIGNWLRLVRLPNLLTVPGDPVAGFLLAAPLASWSTHHVWSAMAASLSFYVAGVILNDFKDVRRDAGRQPWRPLALGLIRLVHVEGAIGFCLVAGLGFSAVNGLDSLLVGSGLAVAIFSYNQELKTIPLIGALNMGVCRALSLWLGAFAAPGNPPLAPVAWAAAGALCCYVAGLSIYASYERRPRIPPAAAMAPLAGAVLAAGLMRSLWAPLTGEQQAGVVALLVVWVSVAASVWLGSLQVAMKKTGTSSLDSPRAVGRLLRGVLLLQAALILMSGITPLSMGLAILLILAWGPHRLLEKIFYAS